MDSDRTRQKLDSEVQRQAKKRDKRISGKNQWAGGQSDEEEVSDPGDANLLEDAFVRKDRSTAFDGRLGAGGSNSRRTAKGDIADAADEPDGSATGGSKTVGGKQKGRVKQSDAPVERKGGGRSSGRNESEDDEDDASDEEAVIPAGQVQCKLQFNVTHGHTDGWQALRTKLLPTTTTIAEFDRLVHNRVAILLEEDGKLLHLCRRNNHLLCYEIIFEVPCCGELDYRPTDSKHKFNTIGDLFSDRDAAGLRLRARVPVLYQEHPKNVGRQPKYKFIVRKGVEVAASHLVVQGRDLDKKHDRNEYSYTRLGNLFNPPSDSEDGSSAKKKSPAKSLSRTSDKAADKTAEEPRVPVRKTLIGRWFTRYLATGVDLSLLSIKAWDFGDICIGDPTIGKDHDFAGNDDYLLPYQNVADHNQLAQLVVPRQANRLPEMGSAVPFMPSHTLNDFDSKALGLGVRFDDQTDMNGVFRFVDHLPHRNKTEDKPKGALSPPWLPFDVQLTFEPTESADDIIKELIAELKRYVGRDDLDEADKDTLQTFLKREDWKLQLWVLPQECKKMYRYPNAHARSWNSLEEYLSKAKVEEDGEFARTLYMEAHIVRKDGSKGKAAGVKDGTESDGKAAGKGKKVQKGEDGAKGRAGEEDDDYEWVEGGKKKARGKK